MKKRLKTQIPRIFSLNKTLKLFVAGYDGVVCVYEVNTNDGGECKQISQYLLFSMSPNQQANMGKFICKKKDKTKQYSIDLGNDNVSVPLSSTPPTSARTIIRQTSDTSIDEQNYSRLASSPSQGVYD